MGPYRNLEEYNIELTNEVKERYKNIIDEIGEDVEREGLLKTPERAAKAMLFLTQGYKQDAEEILKSAMPFITMKQIGVIEVGCFLEGFFQVFFARPT